MQAKFSFVPAAAPDRPVGSDRRGIVCSAGGSNRKGRSNGPVGPAAHDALLVLDIETIPDDGLLPKDWPADRFPKNAWHRIVAISFVIAEISRGEDGLEAYEFTECRSGGEPGWDEARLLRSFWRFFEARRYRVVSWNGRAFDMPTIIQRSMMHGVSAASWYRRGTRWEGYGHRFATDWHTDLMDALSEHGAASRMTLAEAAASIGLPGKMGEHGSGVSAMVAAGDIGRVRRYCETDCLNLAALYVRWAHLTGRTDEASHDETILGLMSLLESQAAERPHLGSFLAAWRQESAEHGPLLGGHSRA